MYKVINTATGETRNIENPRYVCLTEIGTWDFCEEAAAQCLAINGKRFSIFGKEKIADAPEVVIIKKVDAGLQMQEVLKENLKQAATLEEVKAAIIDCYDCILDIYENGVGKDFNS